MKIVLAAEASKKIQRFFKLWGLSFSIDGTVLFDAFSNGRMLLRNLKRFGVNVENVRHIVLSHEHWDHFGGLEELLKVCTNVKVYICKSFSRKFEEDLRNSRSVDIVRVSGPTQIVPGVFSSGEIGGTFGGKPIVEQCLIVDRGEELDVLVGCCHPGVDKMLRAVIENFRKPIRLLAGGFHLMGKEREEISRLVDEIERMKVKMVMPCHCTGKEAVELFRERFQDRFIAARVGLEL